VCVYIYIYILQLKRGRDAGRVLRVVPWLADSDKLVNGDQLKGASTQPSEALVRLALSPRLMD